MLSLPNSQDLILMICMTSSDKSLRCSRRRRRQQHHHRVASPSETDSFLCCLPIRTSTSIPSTATQSRGPRRTSLITVSVIVIGGEPPFEGSDPKLAGDSRIGFYTEARDPCRSLRRTSGNNKGNNRLTWTLRRPGFAASPLLWGDRSAL